MRPGGAILAARGAHDALRERERVAAAGHGFDIASDLAGLLPMAKLGAQSAAGGVEREAEAGAKAAERVAGVGVGGLVQQDRGEHPVVGFGVDKRGVEHDAGGEPAVHEGGGGGLAHDGDAAAGERGAGAAEGVDAVLAGVVGRERVADKSDALDADAAHGDRDDADEEQREQGDGVDAVVDAEVLDEAGLDGARRLALVQGGRGEPRERQERGGDEQREGRVVADRAPGQASAAAGEQRLRDERGDGHDAQKERRERGEREDEGGHGAVRRRRISSSRRSSSPSSASATCSTSMAIAASRPT